MTRPPYRRWPAVNSSASFNGVNVTFANNNAAGATNGRAIDLSTSTVTLACSIVWNHTSSLNSTAQNVDYSDVQGGYSGAANLNTNPLFVNTGVSDFHLQSGSPLRVPLPNRVDLRYGYAAASHPAHPTGLALRYVARMR